MRVGCAAYSYREALKGGTMSLEGFVDACAAMELDGVELTSYYFPATDRQYLNALKRHCFLRGQHVLATAVGSNFTQADGAKRREHVEMTLDWIDRSVILGAPCIRVFAGPIPEGVGEEQAFAWALECLEECVARGEQQGVAVALENHGGVTSTAAQVERFLDRLDSPWFGVNLDFGNFREDPYAEFARVAPRAITTHAKLVSRFGEERGEVDYRRVRGIMEEAGYRGYLSIEYEETEDPAVAVPRFAAHLRDVFRS
jgi:sugar phosphate isomerase/epimerase